MEKPDGDRLSNREIGRLGERLAARWLTREGWKVLWRNYRAKHGGEVDLICRHGEVLVFVEVKTRTSDYFGHPADAVNLEKQRLVIRGAQSWLRHLDHPDVLFRFDILEVLLQEGTPPRVNWIENAFQLSGNSIL